MPTLTFLKLCLLVLGSFNSVTENLVINDYDLYIKDVEKIGITSYFLNKLGIESLREITQKIDVNQFQIEVKIYIGNYWEKIQGSGLGLSQIDDFVILIVLIRLFILLFRYNIPTAFAISIVSTVAGYLWYSALLGTVFTFEQLLYQNSLTFRLAKDANELNIIMQGKVNDGSFKLRVTNPIGILGYAIGKGIVYNGHFIDPISMIITKLPFIISKIPLINRMNIDVVDPYYFTVRKIIPTLLRLGMETVDQLVGFGSYAFLTRVNKRYCPYLVRWHWTILVTFQFMTSFYIYFILRLLDYRENCVYPKILQAKEYNLSVAPQEFEMETIRNIVYILLISQIAFLLFAMFHALAGQYFFIPLFTKNAELHIGKREPELLYCGGETAWQNSNEEPKWWFVPKVWYGWFGRGTKKPNMIIVIIRVLIYKPIYNLVRKILKVIKKMFIS